MASDPKRVLRTSRQTLWLFVVIPGVPLALMSVLEIYAVVVGNPIVWQPPVITALLLAMAVAVAVSTKLVLTPDAIHYQSLLHKVDISLADVVKVECAFGFIAFSYKPYQRIVVTVRKTSCDKEVILNGGLFDQRQIKQWVDACNSALNE